MGKIVRSDPKITWSVIDTYAQLLYKMNQKQKAIEWEEKIISLYPELKKYVKIVALMKGNRPTYLEEGANWDGINHVNREGFK